MRMFADLKSVCPGLAVLCDDAVESIATNPQEAMEKLSFFAESLIRAILAFEGLEEPFDSSQITRLNLLSNRLLLPPNLLPFFHVLNNVQTAENLPSAAIQMRASLFLKLSDSFGDLVCQVIWPSSTRVRNTGKSFGRCLAGHSCLISNQCSATVGSQNGLAPGQFDAAF